MGNILYKIWNYSKVERTKDKLIVETDVSYAKSLLIQGIFLALFASSLVAIFLTGLSIYFFIYGVVMLSILVFLFAILPIMFLPELVFAQILGYDVIQTTDTSKWGRYKITSEIIIKSKGFLRGGMRITGINNSKKKFAYEVGIFGKVGEEKGSEMPQPIGIIFAINNIAVAFRSLSIFLMALGTLVFSFFPIVNIIVITIIASVLIRYFKVQWEEESWLQRLFAIGALLVLFAHIVFALLSYLIVLIILVVPR
ncbi:MAG: hypothetical protein AABW59_03345 [archaeon]